MSRKSTNRPTPWLLSCASAESRRSRSPAVNRVASFRILTITVTEPIGVLPTTASSRTSPLFVLGRPNLPATRNGTETPVIGTDTVRLLENAPEVPLWNTTAPPPGAELPLIWTLTMLEGAPVGFVIRIRQGEGAQVTNRAAPFALLLTWNSAVIVRSSSGESLPRCPLDSRMG